MRRSPSVPLSAMNDGINAFQNEARANQAIDALNATNDDGDLRRRPAFRSITHGAVHRLPAAACVVKRYNAGWTTYANRQFSFAGNLMGGSSSRRLLIGCAEKFSGIDWRKFSESGSPQAGQRFLKPQFVTGTDMTLTASFTAVPFFIDTTLRNRGDGDNQLTLHRDGKIAWHSSSAEYEAWTQVALDGETLYWIALDLSGVPVVPDGTVRNVSSFGSLHTIVVSRPGVTVFQLAPVKGLAPTDS